MAALHTSGQPFPQKPLSVASTPVSLHPFQFSGFKFQVSGLRSQVSGFQISTVQLPPFQVVGAAPDGTGYASGLMRCSSTTLAGIYPEETTEAVRDVFDRVIKNGAWVPGLWRLEVANVLEMGVRRGRHDAAFRDASLADLALLPVSVDTETDRQAWGATVQLASRHRLTLYDAAYLELAQRRGLPLATLDRELRAAAGKEGMVLLGD